MPPQNQPPEYPPADDPSAGLPYPPPGRTARPEPPQAQAQPADRTQAEVSRRSLLRGGLAAGGIGLAVAAGAGAAVGITRDPSPGSPKPVGKPVVFPHLDRLNKAGTARADLAAVLLTGIPAGIIPGFTNHTGPVQADLLRLNTSIPAARNPNPLGLLGGDLAGFPNGRRVFDDVVSVELRAVSGATVPLVDKSFTPDDAAGALTDGLTRSSVPAGFLDRFPYLGVPYSGFGTGAT